MASRSASSSPPATCTPGSTLQPGCQKLDGVQSLAYARSRYYEEFRDGEWRIDPRADLGRIERQQLFMRAAVNGALETVQSSPFGSGGVLDAVVSSVRIDASVDPIKAGEALRRAAAEKLDTYTLPVYGDTVDGNVDPAPRRRFRGHPRLLPRCRPGPATNRDLVSSPHDSARVCRTVRG